MNIFTIVRRTVQLQIMTSPGLIGFQTVLSAFHALSWTASVIVTQRLFDTVYMAASGNVMVNSIFFALLWMAIVIFVQQMLNGLYSFMIVVVTGKTSGIIRMHLFRKLSRIDPARFEDTEFLDDLNKAKEAVGVIPYFSMTFTDLAVFYIVYFISVGAYLFWLSPMLIGTLALAFVPAIVSQLVRVRVFTKLEEENAPLRRVSDHYQSTICDREYFKETRILGAYRFFFGMFKETMLMLTSNVWQAERKTALLQLSLNIFSFIGMAIAILLLFNATMTGVITIGAFAAVFGALSMIFDTMDEIINENLGQRSKDIGKVSNFIKLMDMPEKRAVSDKKSLNDNEVKCRDATDCRVENIYFTYPGRRVPAIKNVSLNISKGEIISIVGENGAGKSTLIRLLTGIYLPSSGTTSAHGIDFTGISAVFQNYQRYKMTLAENVSISDRNTAKAHDINKISSALSEAGADFDLDLETMLSPEFSGIDLSGGQWQRLAIARGIYRSSEFIVLDEPTAAIDPIEEVVIYQQFQRLAKGKYAIIVTHRLGSAKFADRIVVMDKGEIVDIGTHEELYTRPGKYSEMWNAQSQWYERKE